MGKRNRALRRKQRVNEGDLSPGIAAGLTQGASKKEALEQHPVSSALSGVELVRHMRDEGNVEGTRVPLPRFVASEDADSVWLDEPTGRLQKNATLTFQPDTMSAIRSGMICLRCLEPQGSAFPDVCDSDPEIGCTYPIKDRQILDVAMEFEGNKHLGPARPITDYLAEQEERAERRRFESHGVRGISITRKIKSPGVRRQEDTGKTVILPKGVRLG